MTKYPAVRHFRRILTERLFLTFLKFSICLELPSDSEKYLSFAVAFPSLCIPQNAMLATALELFVATPASQNPKTLVGISHSNVLGAFEICLELTSDSKDQVSPTVDEFVSLCMLLKSLYVKTLCD